MAALLDDVKIASDDQIFGPDLSPDFSDNYEGDFEQDLPSEAIGGSPTAARVRSKLKPTTEAVPARVKARVAAEFELWLEMFNGLWGLRCEHCADHNQQYLANLAKRGANIAARYPDLVEKIVAGGMLADAIALMSAAAPIVKHGIGHHVTHTIRYADDEEPDGVDTGFYEQHLNR